MSGNGRGIVLEADKLCLKFGAVEALKDLSFAVAEDEVHSVIGPNGAGKSSLLNCLSGFYRPYSGSVRFHGEDISVSPPHRRAAPDRDLTDPTSTHRTHVFSPYSARSTAPSTSSALTRICVPSVGCT